MADFHYYVSTTNGSDDYDGLTVATAWKTIIKASAAATSHAGGDTYIHIAPGTYRGRWAPTSDGISATERIIFAGDPNSIFFTSEPQGRVRITGTNDNNIPSAGHVLNFSGKNFAELWDAYVDGSSDLYACYNIPVCHNVHAISYLAGIACGGTYASGANKTFSYYNCTGQGKTGIMQESAAQYSTIICVACIGMGSTGILSGTMSGGCNSKGRFYSCIAYCFGANDSFNVTNSYLYNCTGFGSYVRGSSTAAYDCIFAGGIIYIENYNCISYLSGDSASLGQGILGSLLYCKDGSNSQHLAFDLEKFYPANMFGYENLSRTPYVGNTRITSNNPTQHPLTSEELWTFTPSSVGKSTGVAIRIASKTSTGNIVVELQQYISSTWTTVKTSTKSVTDLASGWNYLGWNDANADVTFNTAASTWRYRVTANNGAESSALYGDSSSIDLLSYYLPDFVLALNEDCFGHARKYDVSLPGAVEHPVSSLDETYYNTSSPSIRIKGGGEEILELPARANQQVTVSYQVSHNGAGAGIEPQLRIRGLGITEQVATHSAGNNVWQALSVTATPTVNGILEVILTSRDPKHDSWFSAPTVS
jgi:hypothetical protein